MHNLFDAADRQSILERLARLQSGAVRQWGKMNAAQMLGHCSAALEVATGDVQRKQALIGKVFAPFVKSSLLGEKPFGKDSPTDPTFIVTDDRDFEAEKRRLNELVMRFGDRGAGKADGLVHSFLGRLTGEQWGVMMHKHLDHHLRQFSS